MDDDEDVGFKFDPKPFLSGIEKAAGGISKLGKTAESVTSGMGKAFQWALVKIEALKVVGRSVVNNIKQFIPELGATWGIAKEIFLKNALWPLRQAMAPYLQKLLDWVRDNRASFVKWGQVVANAFNVVLMVAKQVWGVLQTVASSLKPIIHGSLGDFVNLLLTKVAVLTAWIANGLSALIIAVRGPIAEIVGYVVRLLADTWEWVRGPLGSAWEHVKGIALSVWDLVSGFFQANAQGKSFGTFFKELATTLGLAFETVLSVVDRLIEGLSKSALKDAMTPLTGITASLKALMKSIHDLLTSKESGGLLEWIGRNFGNAVQATLLGAAAAIETMVDGIQWAILTLKAAAPLLQGKPMLDISKEVADLKLEQAARWAPLMAAQKTLGENFLGSFGIGGKGSPETAKDAIVTKEGRVIKTDPADDIFAVMRRTKTGQVEKEPTQGKGGMQVSFGNIHLTVPREWNGFTTPQVDTITAEFRDRILGARIAGGVR